MRTVVAVLIGLVGGFVVGLILADFFATSMPIALRAVISPFGLGIIGAIVAPLIDLAIRKRSPTS